MTSRTWSNGRPRGEGFAPIKRKKYRLGDKVRIVHLMPGLTLEGEVVSEKPVQAKVTQADPVWHGLVVCDTFMRVAVRRND